MVGIAKHVTLLQTPQEYAFSLKVIEWEDGPSLNILSLQRVRLALATEDISGFIEHIVSYKRSGRKVSVSPQMKHLRSPFEKMLSASLKDSDGLLVDCVSYPLEIVNAPMPTDRHNTVILITGCDSSIGRSLVCQMVDLGFTAVLPVSRALVPIF